MGKRVVCLICAGVLIVVALLGVRTWSEPWNGPPRVLGVSNGACLSAGIVKRSPNPLASAMFLILGGLGISMLFDKKNKK